MIKNKPMSDVSVPGKKVKCQSSKQISYCATCKNKLINEKLQN